MPGYNVCGERAVKNIRLIKASSAAFVSAVESFSQLRKKTISAYTCTSARPIFNVATITQRAHKPNFFLHFIFSLSFLFFSDEYAMQNVLSCNHRMFYFLLQWIQQSASVPITVNREERRVCSSVRWARRKFCRISIHRNFFRTFAFELGNNST